MLRQGEEHIGEWGWEVRGEERVVEKGGDLALMQASKGQKMVLADAFFASIMRMGMQRELSISEPAVEGFGINAQVLGGLGDRENGHGTAPLGTKWRTTSAQGTLAGKTPGKCPRKDPGNSSEKGKGADA